VAEDQSAEQILGSAKAGYAAYSWGDPRAAVDNLADDVEWVVPGDSAISGTYHGKKEFGGFLAKMRDVGYSQEPELFLGDEETVMVLFRTITAGHSSYQVDILTYRGGKVVKGQTVLDTEQTRRIFGAK
jgi:ketosteroid isomerase-like protein